jgi:YrbI family 3-deoxy-D-manno-octulosonate 8-phosphate phosphatase
MNRYLRNIEYLCRKNNIDQTSLADEIKIDFTDLRRPTPEDLIKIADYFNLSIDILIRKDLQKINQIKSKNIKLLLMDVDGVLTDAGIYYTENGDEVKKFNARDGLAIKKLSSSGIMTGIISHAITDNIIKKRAEVLAITKFIVTNQPKLQILENWIKELNITVDEVAYIGDDLNDEDIMKTVGISACPNDALPQIKKISTIILDTKGGQGCVREFIDNYLL